MPEDVKCHRCGQEFAYTEGQDKEYNDLIPINGRKMVVDENDNSFPLYAFPLDKRRLVDVKFIKLECQQCIKPPAE
jgi:hypothetical protein